MALSSAKHEAIHNKTGDDLAAIKANFDNGKHLDAINFPVESAIMYQIQKMQDEIDYLRTEISDNKDKTTFPGFGTSGSTALAGDTNIVTIGSSTTIAFGDMVTVTDAKTGRVTGYNIVMTVTNGGVSKTITHTLT